MRLQTDRQCIDRGQRVHYKTQNWQDPLCDDQNCHTAKGGYFDLYTMHQSHTIKPPICVWEPKSCLVALDYPNRCTCLAPLIVRDERTFLALSPQVYCTPKDRGLPVPSTCPFTLPLARCPFVCLYTEPSKMIQSPWRFSYFVALQRVI